MSDDITGRTVSDGLSELDKENTAVTSAIQGCLKLKSVDESMLIHKGTTTGVGDCVGTV